VVEIVNTIGLRAAQLHGDETAEETSWVAERVPLVIKAFPAGHRNIQRVDSFGARLIMVDAESPGAGRVFDWRLAEGVVDPARLIVSGGLNAENVAQAISHLNPFGVDVSTGVESSPGVKDPRKVRSFVVAARRAAGETDEAVPSEIGVHERVGSARGGAPDEGASAPYDWEQDR
jgi:phosphoribosylanthranilate isomerase